MSRRFQACSVCWTVCRLSSMFGKHTHLKPTTMLLDRVLGYFFQVPRCHGRRRYLFDIAPVKHAFFMSSTLRLNLMMHLTLQEPTNSNLCNCSNGNCSVSTNGSLLNHSFAVYHIIMQYGLQFYFHLGFSKC